MVRRIYLHIGTHKTGTTSFQAMLVEQAEHLRGHGVEPYVERRGGGSDGNCFALVHDILRVEAVTGSRYLRLVARPGFWRLLATARHVRRFLGAARGRDVVFSAEAFSFLRTWAEWARLRLVFGFFGVRIVPLLVLRNAADWRASWLDQIAKHPLMGPRMGDADFPLLADWWFDRGAICRFWAQVGDLRVLDYDAVMARDGDIVGALLAQMGVPGALGAEYRLNLRSGQSL